MTDAELKTETGLTSRVAAQRLADEGPNELPQGSHRSVWRIILEVLREPMLALLLLGGAIYLAFGDLRDGLVLLGFACISVAITTVQESRTERMLEALRDLTSPRALVVRDGQRIRIPGREVVRGDLMILSEGDRVAADACLLSVQELVADESLLTGESVPVVKKAAGEQPLEVRPGGDDSPFVFSGTLIVRGTGLAEVTATGERSEIGKIGKSLALLDPEAPKLRAQTIKVVRFFGVFGVATALLAGVLYGMMLGSWMEGALAGIALGMTMLPEEFPVVLTVFLAMGAWRISQVRVLTRRAAAIEALGSATVLCADKTGTLTENRMQVRAIWTDGAELDVRDGVTQGAAAEVALFGMMAAARRPVDPMDAAFHTLAEQSGLDGESPQGRWRDVVQSFGIQSGMLAVTQIWVDAEGNHVAAAKGAPEAILALCHADGDLHEQVDAEVHRLAASGLRMLAVARTEVGLMSDVGSPQELSFRFLGLVGLADPLRNTVVPAIDACHEAGIRVVMITGDHPQTARAIAAEAGLKSGGHLSGAEIATLSDEALQDALSDVIVFSRILPAQKLRIVEAFKKRGEVVAMTGDGVNDAPSLKAAHIGIAMGGRGTDVAREASSIVLLDDDFSAIEKAIRLGRRIYDNLRKAMGFIVAVHVPIAGVALMPLILNMPIIFTPVHIAFLEMIIDPVCSLVFEAEREEPDLMKRPPRSPKAQLLTREMILWGGLQGTLAFVGVAIVYLSAAALAVPAEELRSLTFVTLVGNILALVYVNRTFGASPLTALANPTRALVLVPVLVTSALLIVFLFLPARELFSFGPLHPEGALYALVSASSVFLILETLKMLLFHRKRLSGWLLK